MNNTNSLHQRLRLTLEYFGSDQLAVLVWPCVRLLLPPPCLSLCFEHLLQVHLPPYWICIYSLITYTTVCLLYTSDAADE